MAHIPAVLPRPDVTHPDSLIDGIAKRMAYNPPPYQRGLRRRFRRFVKKWVQKNLRPIEHNDDLGFEEWLETTNYPGWRKDELRKTWNDILEKDSFWILEKDRLHENADVKLFCKEENYPEYKLPRGIWARVDEFKDISGPFFKRIEKELFKLPYFIKKVPKHQRPQYIKDLIERSNLKYICTDFTSFESLFTTDMMMDCEAILYKYMSSKNLLMQRLCRMILLVLTGDNVCGNKYFKVAVDAKRMSGEMNTSLGNGFSNLMFLLFAFHEHNIGFTGPIVEGDDGLAGVDGDIPAQYFTDMGLNVKLEVKENIGEASFCGIVADMQELINITEPLQHLCFVPWVSRRYTFCGDEAFYGLIKSKALSLAYEYPGCPILDKYSRKLLGLLAKWKVKHDKTDSWKYRIALEAERAMNSGSFPQRTTGPCTRVLMEKVFGIPISAQLLFEKAIDEMTLEKLDFESIYSLIPDCWVRNYRKYAYEWTNQEMFDIKRPLFPFGENEIKFKLFQLSGHKIKTMNKTLSKAEYIKLNSRNFSGLTQRQVDQKFAEYLLRKRDKKQRVAKLKGPVPAPKAKYGANSKRNPKPTISKTALSSCVLAYAQATIDPFNTNVKDPCIPDQISAPSFKFNTTVMANMVIGTEGVGYAVLQPATAIVNDNGTPAGKLDYPLITTNATYPLSTFALDVTSISGGFCTGSNSNSYFSQSDFKTGEFRVVAAGIEAFYTGSVLTQAGVVTTLQNDGCQAFLYGPTPVSDYMTNPRATVCATSKDSRCYVSYFPTNADQLSYQRLDYWLPSANPPNGADGYYFMGIFVTGATPGTTFQIKAKVYYEAQIRGLSSSPSESDPIGFAAFQTARSAHKPTDSPSNDLSTVLKMTLRNLGTTISAAAPVLGRAAGTLTGNPEFGGLAGDALSLALNNLLK